MSTSGRYSAAVIVTSDTCAKNPSLDESGTYVVRQLEETNLFNNVQKQIMRDEQREIVACLKTLLVKDPNLALIITVGGTGLCPRDVTPEATSSLYEKNCSGITAGLHMSSQRYTQHAALSRLTSGIVSGTLIINFPGKMTACKDCMNWLQGILEHALEQVREDFEAYRETHRRQQELSSCTSNDHGPFSSASLISDDGLANNVELNMSELTLIDGAPIETPVSKVKSKQAKMQYYKYRRGPSSIVSTTSTKASTGSRLTIDAIMESRGEIPTVESHSMNKSASLRTLKTRILPKTNNSMPSKTNLPKVKIAPYSCNFPMIDCRDALDILSRESKSLLGDPVSSDLSSFLKAMNCIGNVLARDVTPKRIVPNHSVSNMDGYVLNIPSAMKAVIEKSRGDLPPVRLVSSLDQFKLCQKDKEQTDTFFCCQVNTGGRLPSCNYAVIPFEKTRALENGKIQIFEVKQGAYVRRAGTDVGKDDVIRAGTVLGPVEIAVIMAMGHRGVPAHSRPKIGVLSTGDELRDFFTTPNIDDDDVVDTNGPLLTSMLRSKGFVATSLGLAQDDPDDLHDKLLMGLEKNDIIIVTGGASMGTRDHVKSVIAHLKGDIHFGRVNMKPGKPVAFATLEMDAKRKFIFALPGNPVSAYITTTVLVIPFIQNGMRSKYQPNSEISFSKIGDVVDVEIKKLNDGTSYFFDGRLEFLRAKILTRRLDGGGSRPLFDVEVSVKQQSSRMLNLVDCDCLIMIDDPQLKGKFLGINKRYPALKLYQQC